jgi:hypothetical protein
LTIVVDLTKRLGPSKSGKTEIVSSSDGIAKIKTLNQGEFGVGVNVFTERGRA